jgi:D-alanine-D-alanine ligase
MRICLLTNQELDAPHFAEDDWPCDPRPFLPEATWHLAVLGDKVESVRQVKALIDHGVDGQHFDVFFNLCDGAADQPELPGIEVVQAMEDAGVPFTGATSNCYEPTRVEMKDACTSIGVASPAYVLAKTLDDVERAARELRFPLFVKHYSSYASIDISRRSKVMSVKGLRQQAKKIMSRHGAALIEEYIDGIECTVLIAENPADPANPVTYTPVQYAFPKGEQFKHSDLKWVDYGGMSTFPVTDKVLSDRLRRDMANFFVALDFASFARCDVRVDANGTLYMLEINANCGVYFPKMDYGSADFCLSLDPAGHVGFTRLLVDAALSRHRMRSHA